MVALPFTQVIIMGKYTPGSCAVKGCNQPNFEVGCVVFGKFGKQRTVFDVMNFGASAWASERSHRIPPSIRLNADVGSKGR